MTSTNWKNNRSNKYEIPLYHLDSYVLMQLQKCGFVSCSKVLQIKTLYWVLQDNSCCNPKHQLSNLQGDDKQRKSHSQTRAETLGQLSLFGLNPAANCNLSRWLTTIKMECFPKGNDPMFGNKLRATVWAGLMFPQVISPDITKMVTGDRNFTGKGMLSP